MVKTNRVRKGFSLVELVVVILIMGVLAAVAAPKMFDQAHVAKVNGTKQSLSVLRDAIELFKSQSADSAYPKLATFKDDVFPYVKGAFPKNSLIETDDSDDLAAPAAVPIVATNGPTGWLYDENTGAIAANHADVIND